MKCHHHPDRNALSFCHSCGRHFCAQCLTEGGEYYYCQDEACQVALKQFATQPEEPPHVVPDSVRRMNTFIRNYWICFGTRLGLAAVLGFPADLQSALPHLVGIGIGALLGGSLSAVMLNGLRRFSSRWRVLTMAFMVLRVISSLVASLGATIRRPETSWIIGFLLLVDLVWAAYVFTFLMSPATKAEFRRLRLS